MTVSLQQRMIALLTRRTQQAQENAERDVLQLLAAIRLVAQAAKTAECTITLPTHITKNFAKRLRELGRASYPFALDESTRAKRQREVVLEMARSQLATQVQTRKEAADQANAQIEAAKTEAADKKRTAQNIAKDETQIAVSDGKRRRRRYSASNIQWRPLVGVSILFSLGGAGAVLSQSSKVANAKDFFSLVGAMIFWAIVALSPVLLGLVFSGIDTLKGRAAAEHNAEIDRHVDECRRTVDEKLREREEAIDQVLRSELSSAAVQCPPVRWRSPYCITLHRTAGLQVAECCLVHARDFRHRRQRQPCGQPRLF